MTPALQHWLCRYRPPSPLLASLLLRREAPSDHSSEGERAKERKEGEMIEAGRKVWLQQGLEDGAHLEAFGLFLCAFSITSIDITVQLKIMLKLCY